jgi:hypothetical protein
VFEIDFSSDSIESLRVLSLKLPHDTNLLQPDIVALSQFPGRLEAIPGNGSLRLSSRLANGDRIDSIRLQWKDSLRDVESSLEIRFSREFEIIDEALSRLVAAWKRCNGNRPQPPNRGKIGSSQPVLAAAWRYSNPIAATAMATRPRTLPVFWQARRRKNGFCSVHRAFCRD